MPQEQRGPHTLVFWGAGATQRLGIRTTPEQGKFIYTLAGANPGSKSLDGRVAQALAESNREPWRTALVDLINILGDRAESYRSIHSTDESQLDAMRRNWSVLSVSLRRVAACLIPQRG